MIITILAMKGGTGKTATAAALAQAATSKGKRALAVDLDPQASLSFALGADTTMPGSFELLDGSEAAIQSTGQGVDVIAASWNLSTVKGGRGTARRLQRALMPLKGEYDYIVVDTGPLMGELQFNALQAADGVIYPLLADVYSLQALAQMLDTTRQFQTSNPGLHVLGYVLTMYDGRGNLSRHMKDTIKQAATASGVDCLGTIRRGIAVQEAAALQESLFDYAARSNPARDYMELFNRIDEGRK